MKLSRLMRLLGYAIAIPIWVPLYVLVLACRPFVRIKFFQIDSACFGRLVSHPYLAVLYSFRSDSFDPNGPRNLYIGYPAQSSNASGVNSGAIRLVKRYMTVMPRCLIHPIFVIDRRLFPASAISWVPMDTRDDIRQRFPAMRPELETYRKGLLLLQQIGIGSSKKLVLLNVRDGADDIDEPRGLTFRNSSLSSYLEAIEYLHSKGYSVMRVGSRKPAGEIGPLVDYSGLMWDPDIDIFLAAYCDFVISTSAGYDNLASLYQKPILYTDNTALARAVLSCPNSVHTWKSLVRQGAVLSQSEIWTTGAAAFETDAEYSAAGISFHHNSSRELLEATVEFVDRLHGVHVQTANDVKLQENFLAIYRHHSGVAESRYLKSLTATSFLRHHPELAE